MSLPKNFEAEFRRVLAEKAGAALVEVLRRQLPSLTFAELHAVLGSPHGKVIASMPVAALLGGAPEVAVVHPVARTTEVSAAAKPVEAARSDKKSKKSTKAKQSTKAKKSTKAKGETSVGPARASKKSGKKAAKKVAQASEAKRGGAKGQAMEASIVEALRAHGGPMASRDFRAVLKGAVTNTLLRALQRLIDAGKVQRLGESRSSAYALVGGAPVVSAKTAVAPEVVPASEGEAASGKKGTTKKGSKKKSAKAKAKKTTTTGDVAMAGAKGGKGSAGSGAKPGAVAVTSRTIEGRKAYDTAILNTLRVAGDWVTMSDVQQKVGGSEEQVRIGLRRLMEGGSIERIGERQATRYKLAG